MLMLKHLRHPATIISAVALLVALGGGAAAYASGLISGSKIKNHSIPAKKLTASAIKSLHGARGPAGPSHSYENLEPDNLNIGADGTHPVLLTSLTLPGSATYLVSANGSFFPSSGTASDDCDGGVQLDLDSFPGAYNGITYNEVGASMDASGNYLNGMYSVTQLITLPSGSHTLRVDAFMFDGTTVCTSYGNVLTATLVDSATIQAARSNAKAATEVGPPR
jgi:hypothetical protein